MISQSKASDKQNFLLSYPSYSSLCSEFVFREETGFYLPYSIKLDDQYKPYYYIFERISQFLTEGILQAKVDELPFLNIEFLKENYRDLIIVYAILQALVTGYVHATTPPTTRIPPQIAVPFYKVSEILKVNPSNSNLGYSYGWYFEGEQIKLKQNMTGSLGEDTFFGTSTICGIHLARIIKYCFFANLAISNNKVEEVIACLNEIKQDLVKMIEEQKKMFKNVDGEFFFKVIRKYIAGFNSKDNFPNGVYFEGVDKVVNSCGGSAGQDPSFQIFENAIGIKYEGEVNVLRDELKSTMMFKHRELIDLWTINSEIRQFVINSKEKNLIVAYNELIELYANFQKKHAEWINYFIEVQAKKSNPNLDQKSLKGTGNTPIFKIKEKWMTIAKHKIEEI